MRSWAAVLSLVNARTGTWGEFCSMAPDGTVAGFPLAGRWTPDGQHLRDATSFTITCTSGASGKCVRFGYKPWRMIGAESLWDYHQTCVRIVRADYGGDGSPHTRDGTLIDIFDRLGIQRSDRDPDLTFEAAWGPDGAVCVRRTRLAEVLSSEELIKYLSQASRSLRRALFRSRIGLDLEPVVGRRVMVFIAGWGSLGASLRRHDMIRAASVA